MWPKQRAAISFWGYPRPAGAANPRSRRCRSSFRRTRSPSRVSQGQRHERQRGISRGIQDGSRGLRRFSFMGYALSFLFKSCISSYLDRRIHTRAQQQRRSLAARAEDGAASGRGASECSAHRFLDRRGSIIFRGPQLLFSEGDSTPKDICSELTAASLTAERGYQVKWWVIRGSTRWRTSSRRSHHQVSGRITPDSIYKWTQPCERHILGSRMELPMIRVRGVELPPEF